jgi:hypothetical protein
MMNRAGHESANFFFGNEVEHTPAHGMKTLFVVGYHQQEKIDAALYDRNFATQPEPIKHIFFGANDSYRPKTTGDYTAWENVIMTYLDRGFFCSLDIPFEYVEEFHEGGLCERDRFIPIIKVPIPYIKLWNYNTCVKIDDRDFAVTNPGVWVHELRDLMPRNRFTDWSAYEKDEVVGTQSDNATEVLDSQYPDGDDYWRT